MKSFSVFKSPSKIYYGRDSFSTVGKEARDFGKKALIISDKIMDSLGYVGDLNSYLSRQEIESAIYLGVESEPKDTYVEEALGIFKKESCDLVISLGGGSCIDTAKAVAVLAKNGGNLNDYTANKNIPIYSTISHIAIPTTAGTGSEVTDVTVITNTKTNVKMMVKNPAFLPTIAIVDPILTTSTPKNVTAATGIDALSHAIEAYLSKKAHPMTDTFALSAMKLITKNIRKAYFDNSNIEAREAMSLGSLEAGLAFSNSSVCLVHGMSRPIGALFDVPHGVSNAMLLPAVLEYSRVACIDRLADLGRIFNEEELTDEEASTVAVSEVKKLCFDLDIPNLKQWGIKSHDFRLNINKMTNDALNSGSPANNPKVPSEEDIKNLYELCYDYQFENKTITGVEVKNDSN